MVRHKAGPRDAVLVRLAPDLNAEIDAVVAGNDLSKNETIQRMLKHALECKAER